MPTLHDPVRGTGESMDDYRVRRLRSNHAAKAVKMGRTAEYTPRREDGYRSYLISIFGRRQGIKMVKAERRAKRAVGV